MQLARMRLRTPKLRRNLYLILQYDMRLIRVLDLMFRPTLEFNLSAVVVSFDLALILCTLNQNYDECRGGEYYACLPLPLAQRRSDRCRGS